MMRTILVISCLVQIGFCAKILGIFPDYGYSQYILGSTLMLELAKRHEVTMVSTFRQKSTINNFTEIYVDGLHNFLRDHEADDLTELEASSVYHSLNAVNDISYMITEYVLNHTSVQNLLKSKQRFDLVIVEQVCDEALYAFSWRFDAPLVVFVPMGAIEWINEKVANPAPFSYTPHMYSGYSSHMTFLQRFRNFFLHILDSLYRHLISFPNQNFLIKRHFPGAPDLKELMYNISLVLLTSHVAITEAAPLVHNMVEIGGFHIRPKGLPDDLQTFLDNAKEGVVYFNMGSNVKTTQLPEEARNAFIRVFSRLKQKVLWKWESDTFPNQPKNLIVKKWIPQQDVLAHPNVKLFISHGGLLGTMEAAYNGVPIIGIPIFLDQKMNIAKAASMGFAVELPLSKINEENIEKTIQEVLNNPTYQDSVRRVSTIFRDQETNPLDRAVYWIEYILRHKGAYHLRVAALDLNWYQYFGFDVILVALSLILWTLTVVYLSVKRILKACYGYDYDLKRKKD